MPGRNGIRRSGRRSDQYSMVPISGTAGGFQVLTRPSCGLTWRAKKAAGCFSITPVLKNRMQTISIFRCAGVPARRRSEGAAVKMKAQPVMYTCHTRECGLEARGPRKLGGAFLLPWRLNVLKLRGGWPGKAGQDDRAGSCRPSRCGRGRAARALARHAPQSLRALPRSPGNPG